MVGPLPGDAARGGTRGNVCLCIPCDGYTRDLWHLSCNLAAGPRQSHWTEEKVVEPVIISKATADPDAVGTMRPIQNTPFARCPNASSFLGLSVSWAIVTAQARLVLRLYLLLHTARQGVHHRGRRPPPAALLARADFEPARPGRARFPVVVVQAPVPEGRTDDEVHGGESEGGVLTGLAWGADQGRGTQVAAYSLRHVL